MTPCPITPCSCKKAPLQLAHRPLEALEGSLRSPRAFSLPVFHSLQKWPRVCIRNVWGLTHFYESGGQPVTLVEAGSQGWPPLSQSLQQHSQLLPSATLPLVQLSSHLLLLSAAGTAPSMPSMPLLLVPDRALTGAL